ncbi:hypothetical protein [Streptomyces sp. NPDC002994]|uniref:hypothetical protein n=1 Tax=Streptomyces sp. NPDC002994 TaxID=3154441 RepID=UPI0033A5C3BF
MSTAVSALAAIAPLAIIALGFDAGVNTGIWVAVCALGTAVGIAATALAMRGRTRWAVAGFMVAFTLGTAGDLLSGRPFQTG